jgi:hypothetical protein
MSFKACTPFRPPSPLQGTYYLSIRGAGRGANATTGFTSYGSTGQYRVTITAPATTSGGNGTSVGTGNGTIGGGNGTVVGGTNATNGTTGSSKNGTVGGVLNGTIGGIINGTVGGSKNGTVNGTVGGVANGTIGGGANGTTGTGGGGTTIGGSAGSISNTTVSCKSPGDVTLPQTFNGSCSSAVLAVSDLYTTGGLPGTDVSVTPTLPADGLYAPGARGYRARWALQPATSALPYCREVCSMRHDGAGRHHVSSQILRILVSASSAQCCRVKPSLSAASAPARLLPSPLFPNPR